MAASNLQERTTDYPACPVCDNERTFPRRPHSTVFTCPDCGMVFVKSDTSVSLLGSDSVYCLDQ
jgi:ribosomal protein L37AE/L43A